MDMLIPTPVAAAVAAMGPTEASDEIREPFVVPKNTLFLHKKQMEVYSCPKRFKVVVAGRRWGKCLHSGSLVKMADGSDRPIESLCPGEIVLTVNENSYKLQPRKVMAVESNGVKETVIVKTAGRTLRSTPHHPILANNRWIDAGKLQLGDLVAVERSTAVVPLLPFTFAQLEPRMHAQARHLLGDDVPDSWVSAARYEALRGFSDGFFDPIADGDVAWEEVTAVEQAEKAMTWDLSVEGNHNYIANGIVVHNTQLAKTSLIKFARKKKRLVWYVAPSYRMAKQIMWPELVEAIPRAWVKKYNETILCITLINGTKIELKGADNPDSLRGVGIHYLVMDEVQDIDPEAWKKVLRPTLASTGGHCLFIGTPKGFTFLHEIYMLGQKGLRDWASWQFPTETSPFIPLEELRSAKEDMDEKSYNQEFNASFETMSGRVYHAFDRKVHVKPLEFNPDLPIWIGQDFNIDPMSSVVFQYQPRTKELWAVDEICLPSSNTEELCDELERRYWRFLNQITIYPDPAGAYRGHQRGESDLDVFRERGFKKQKYRKKHPPVADRVNAVNRMLKSATGTVRMYVDPRCKKFIEALEQTLYRPGSREVNKAAGVEHAADAGGYCIEFEFPVRKIEILGVSV